MRANWFSDNRDLVKWGVLLRLAEQHNAAAVLQVAYYRPGPRSALEIEIDGQMSPMPSAVLNHFRTLGNASTIRSNAKIIVKDDLWQDRDVYLADVLRCVSDLPRPSIVFLDPDTGLAPKSKPRLEHVLEGELRAIWHALRPGDVLVFYQHQTNRGGRPWIEEKKAQFEKAMGLIPGSAKVADGKKIARDVAFFFSQKRDST